METACVEFSSRIQSAFDTYSSSTTGHALAIERFEVVGAGDADAYAARVRRCLTERFAGGEMFALYESLGRADEGESGGCGRLKGPGDKPLYCLRGHIETSERGIVLAGRLLDASSGKVLFAVHAAAPRHDSGAESPSPSPEREGAAAAKARPWRIAPLVGIALRNRFRNTGFDAGVAVLDPTGKYEFSFDHTRFSTPRSVHIPNGQDVSSQTRFDYTVYVREYRLLAARLLRRRKVAQGDSRAFSLLWNLRVGGGIQFTEAEKQFLQAQGRKVAPADLDAIHRASQKPHLTSGVLLAGVETRVNGSLGLQLTGTWAFSPADTLGFDIMRGGLGLTAVAVYYFDLPRIR